MTHAAEVERVFYPRVGGLVEFRTSSGTRIGKVVKVKQVKAIVRTEDGLEYDCTIRGLKAAPEGATFTEPASPELRIHTHVKFKPGSPQAAKCPGLMFITGRAGALNSWRLAIVGTERYYREIPGHELVPVEVIED